CLETICGQFFQILLNGLGATLHIEIGLVGLLAKTTKADTTRAKPSQAKNCFSYRTRPFKINRSLPTRVHLTRIKFLIS
ncbi:MAG: hypothetical protein ABIV39_04940, partial [Verrucomicrobiota bacterium]